MKFPPIGRPWTWEEAMQAACFWATKMPTLRWKVTKSPDTGEWFVVRADSL